VIAALFLAPCSQADLRITAYYPGYKQGTMPASEIDFSVITHLLHFSVVPNGDGTLNSGANGITVTTDRDRWQSMVEALCQLDAPQSPGPGLFLFALRDELRRGDPLGHTWRDGAGREIKLI